MKTNMENYEERFVDYMEGQLNAAEMSEVEAFVAQHPELEDDFKLFCASKLVPDESIVFTQKDSLTKPKAVVMPLFAKIMATAASIALLIGIGVHFMNRQKPIREEIAIISSLTPKTLAKIEVPETPMKLKPSSVKAVPLPTPIVEREEPMMLAQAEVIPTLASIKSKAIEWHQSNYEMLMESRIDMDLEYYLAALNPIEETESFEVMDEDDGLFPKLSARLYKRTAKTLLTAYYTADCYINEARRNVRR